MYVHMLKLDPRDAYDCDPRISAFHRWDTAKIARI